MTWEAVAIITVLLVLSVVVSLRIKKTSIHKTKIEILNLIDATINVHPEVRDYAKKLKKEIGDVRR